MTDIYVATTKFCKDSKEVLANAFILEDGQIKFVCSRISSDNDWAKIDLGVVGNKRHDLYKKLFPDGFRVKWFGEVVNLSDLIKEIKLN